MSLILFKDGAYNEYSTIADAPLWESALTLAQLEASVRAEQGENGVRALQSRLDRAHKTGCSSGLGLTLAECIDTNRAGPSEAKIPLDDFIKQYLTLPEDSNP